MDIDSLSNKTTKNVEKCLIQMQECNKKIKDKDLDVKNLIKKITFNGKSYELEYNELTNEKIAIGRKIRNAKNIIRAKAYKC